MHPEVIHAWMRDISKANAAQPDPPEMSSKRSRNPPSDSKLNQNKRVPTKRRRVLQPSRPSKLNKPMEGSSPGLRRNVAKGNRGRGRGTKGDDLPNDPTTRRVTRSQTIQGAGGELDRRLVDVDEEEGRLENHAEVPTKLQHQAESSREQISYALPLRSGQPSSASTRTTSPSKKSARLKFGAMQHNKDSIKAAQIENIQIPEARKIFRKVREIASFKGVLRDPPEVDLDISILKEDNFYSSDAPLINKPDTFNVQELVEESQECYNDGHGESTWNAHVHYPLLYWARKGCDVSSSTKGMSITSASLSNFLPRVDETQHENRKIDFGIVFRPSDELKNGLKGLGIDANPTSYLPLKFAPLGVLIETKTHDQDAMRQLGVWSFAIFNHLRTELGNAPPFLPLISIGGEEWRLCFATQEAQQDSSEFAIVIYKSLAFGNSSSVIGVYRILSVLAYLFDWVGTNYKTWFEDQVKAAMKKAEK